LAKSFPKVIGCGFVYDQNNNTYSVSPLIFPKESRGPNPLLRKSLIYSDVYTNNNQLFTIYDRNKVLTIPYFECLLPVVDIEYYLSLDDDDFLETISTSPHCEPSHFCSDFREVLLFCKEPNNIINQFNTNGNIKFCLQYRMGNNGWEEVLTTIFNNLNI
jgi:hypothetical protein